MQNPQGKQKKIDFFFLLLVSKALLVEYIVVQKRNKPFKGLGLEHMNKSYPVVQSQLTSSTLRSSQFQLQAQGLSREYALL
uniref:Uncharacterized protein n=1 Tax=Vitis vinifera TaxID=29760 RepID=F6HT08_VITVI